MPINAGFANYVPELWAREVLFQYQRRTVFDGLTNRSYEGEITQAGDTVHIISPGDLTVNTYTGTVTYEDPTSTEQTLLIDQQKYVAFKVDDVDRVQSRPDLIGTYSEKQARAMAQDVDTHIAGRYTDVHADNVIVKDTLTAANIYSKLVEAGKRLDRKDVPRDGRWITVSPDEYALLLQAPEFINASDLPENVVQTGAVGMIAGFGVFMSNNLVAATDGTNTVRHLLYGTNDAITFASQIVENEAVRLETQFGFGIRMLRVYGSKMVRPAAAGDLRAIVA